MKKSRFTGEQITYALKQADSGTPVANVCRQLVSVKPATFFILARRSPTMRSRFIAAGADDGEDRTGAA